MTNLKDRIRAAWQKIPNAIRSGINTAWVTFAATTIGILAGLIPTLSDFLGDLVVDGKVTLEPYLEALSAAKAAVLGAATALIAGVGNIIFRTFKPIAGAYPPNNTGDI